MMHSMSVGPSPVSEGNLNGFRKFWSCSLVMSCIPFYRFYSSQSASTTDRIGHYVSTIRTNLEVAGPFD